MCDVTRLTIRLANAPLFFKTMTGGHSAASSFHVIKEKPPGLSIGAAAVQTLRMDATVARRLLHGLGANAYGQLVTVIVQLVGVPILLHAWGTQLYGEWLILFAIPAYLSMTDLGFSQSAGNDMSARVARGDRAGALAVFQSLGVAVYAIAGVGLVLSAVLVWRLPLAGLHFEAMNAQAAHWVLWLLCAQVFVALPDGVNHAGFRACGDYALHMGLNSTMRLFQYSSIWIVALGGGGPVAAATAFFVVRAIAGVAFALLLVQRHRWLHFGMIHARRAELQRLARPALANMAIPLAQALNVQGMVLVVGAVLGPLAVVVFSTLRTLTRLALQLVLAVANAAEPELAVAYGVGNHVLMRDLFVQALRGALWLALATAIGLAVFGGVILDVWTHGNVSMHPALFACLLGSALASVLWYGALIVLKAANRHLRAASIYVFASAAAVGLAAMLLHGTGSLAGAGMALLAMDTIMVLFTLGATAPLLQARPLASVASAANPLPLLNLIRGKALVR
ncbi:hypothetical protein [Rhodanobacter sp. KK11]|uniref:lipopolysaccharide biosynthesis protein n=1 Tax=Rhodanobacter sp. KK11 TaxID=3083255 RepID=UPI00296656E7|nr:hypothetical protein [Rhodanobacter sp. KK11]MDW2980344.1 hypothetical protein [Rhodanobacter sp. KK11]